jgi:CheY-like chemotaxis protein
MSDTLTIMLVEKSAKSQEAFRRFFHSLGLKVLVSANAERAVNRIFDHPPPAHGIVISSLELGDAAVAAFNSLSDPGAMRNVPALLIVNQKSPAVVEAAQCDDRRKIIFVPMSVPEVIEALGQVFTNAGLGAEWQAILERPEPGT